MQQQQQHADYDLLAAFTDEEKADTAVAKLHKEGFGEQEVYQLEASAVHSGQFRDHGPRTHRDYFLQTQRSGPNLLLVLLFSIILGIVLGGLSFAASFAMPILPAPTTPLLGLAVGLLLGAILGVLRGRRVRGNIGQESSRATRQHRQAAQGAKTVVALRFPNLDNISRKSRARAILLNNGGRIDRSVKKRE